MSPLADVPLRLPAPAERPSLAARLRSTGWLLLPDVLPADTIVALDRHLAEVIAATDPGDEKTVVVDTDGHIKSVHGLDRRSEEAFDLARHPRLTRLAVDLLGAQVTPFLTEFYRPRSAAQAARPPHQDQVFREEHFWDELAVTFWMPLTPVTAADAPPEFGRPCPPPFRLLPHRPLGDRAFDEQEMVTDPSEAYEPVLARPGDLVAYHAYAVWRVRPGSPDRPRRVFASHYRTTPERS